MNAQPTARLRQTLRHSLGRIGSGGAFLLTAVLATVGLPMVLARYVGWPLPRRWPDGRTVQSFLTEPLDDTMLINALACVVWLLWALFTLALAVEITAAVRGRAAPRLPGLRLFQTLAATLVGVATVAIITLVARSVPALHGPAPNPPSPPGAIQLTAAVMPTTDAAPNRPPAGPALAGANDRLQKTHRVKTGDTLWDIADRYFGDPERWLEIYRLNRGRPQPHGAALTDPDAIEPGWVLLLPTRSTTTPPITEPRKRHPPAAPKPPSTKAPRPAPRSPTSSPSPTQCPPSNPGNSAGAIAPPALGPTGRPTPDRPTNQEPGPPPDAPPDSRHQPVAVHLPSGAVIGLSLAIALAAAIALARLHRRRRRTPSTTPGETAAEPPLSEPLARVRRAHLAATSQPAPHPTSEPPDVRPLEAVPEALDVAISNEAEVPLHFERAPGIGLIGDGSEAAARAVIVTTLAQRPKDQPEILIPTQDAATLLGETAKPDTIPGLTTVDSLPEALTRLESEIIHRGRLLDTAEETDFRTYRTQHPDEHLPSLMLIARPEPRYTTRTISVLALGRSVGIVGLLLAPWPDGGTCSIETDGTVIAADSHAVHHLIGTRMAQLSHNEAAEMLTTLAAAHGHQPERTPDESSPRILPEPSSEPSKRRSKPVELAILGPIQLTASGTQITKGMRRKGFELLAYLALHPDGATTETIVDALWPQARLENGANSLYSVTTNIRRILRDTTGAGEAEFLLHTGDRYRLDPNLIEVDYWRFRDHLAQATRADTPEDKTRHLQDAAATWTGSLDIWPHTEWLEPWQETLRRDIVDTLTLLAQRLEADQPDQALTALEHAINYDKYAEELYQRIMKLQHQLGWDDAVRRTFEHLEARLAEIDAEIDERSVGLLQTLLRGAVR